MANQNNTCADLPIEDWYNSNQLNKDTFKLIYDKQKELQERLGYNFEAYTLKDIADFWFMNKHALEDEIGEMFDALGGINDGIGNAAWKPWKQANQKAQTQTVNDLSKEDKLELFYEFIDGLHFFMNFALALGLSAEDIINLYMAKNAENFDRADRGY